MSGEGSGPAEFGAGYWEGRYAAGDPTSGYAPSPSLVEAAAALPPGRALDAGCGRGADALWLAARGWQVTAVDVAATALASAESAGRAAGPEVAGRTEWVHADLTTWSPGAGRFDLVTSHYVHLPGPPGELVRRLASWVAPGGTLLVVGHDAEREHDPGTGGHGHEGGHGQGSSRPPGALLRLDQVTGALPEDVWQIVVAEPRAHSVHRPSGGEPVTLHDVVVHARRTGPARP